MKRVYKKLIIIVLIIFIILVGYKTYKHLSNTINDVTFSRIVDGDSFFLNIKGEEIECRLIGVDAPEIKDNEEYSKEAKFFSQDKLSNANKIKVEYEDGNNKLDKYGRHLVYVFVDDKLLQTELLKQGYAKVAYVYDDYKYLQSMKEAEVYARSKHLNIWK